MAKKKKNVKEPEIIYFINNGNVVEGIVLFETELNYLVSYNAGVNHGWCTIDVNAEKLVSIDDAFEYYNDCTTELRLRNLEKKQETAEFCKSQKEKLSRMANSDWCNLMISDLMEETKPWYKRIFS